MTLQIKNIHFSIDNELFVSRHFDQQSQRYHYYYFFIDEFDVDFLEDYRNYLLLNVDIQHHGSAFDYTGKRFNFIGALISLTDNQDYRYIINAYLSERKVADFVNFLLFLDMYRKFTFAEFSQVLDYIITYVRERESDT